MLKKLPIKQLFRISGVLVMLCLLALLTTLNFVIYSSQAMEQRAGMSTAMDSNQNNTLPDEKVPDNPNGVSEEFLHDTSGTETITLTITNRFPFSTSTALESRASSLLSPPPES